MAYEKSLLENPIKCIRPSGPIRTSCHIAWEKRTSYRCLAELLLSCHPEKRRTQPQYLRSRLLLWASLVAGWPYYWSVACAVNHPTHDLALQRPGSTVLNFTYRITLRETAAPTTTNSCRHLNGLEPQKAST